VKRAWSKQEIAEFLIYNPHNTAAYLVWRLHRTKAAIMGMRRKLKLLRELGVRQDLVRMLQVNEVYYGSLSEIRRRAAVDDVPVKPFLRRNRLNPGVHLVNEHQRQPQGDAR